MFFPSLFLTGAPPRGGSALTFLCWPSSFQRTLANSPRFSAPRSFRVRVQKYYIFPYLQQLFSLFFNIFTFYLNIREINFTLFAIIAAARRFFGGNAASGGFPGAGSCRLPRVSARFRRKSARVSRPQCRYAEARDGLDSGLFRRTPYYIYVRMCLPDVSVGCVCRMCLSDVPVGTLPRTPAAYMVAVVASSRRFGRYQFCRFCET